MYILCGFLILLAVSKKKLITFIRFIFWGEKDVSIFAIWYKFSNILLYLNSYLDPMTFFFVKLFILEHDKN